MDDGLAALVNIAATGLIGLLGNVLYRVFGLVLDAEHRKSLEAAAANAITLALSRYTGDDGGVNVPGAIREAAKYLRASTPDAIGRFSLDERLEDFLEARLVSRLERSA